VTAEPIDCTEGVSVTVQDAKGASVSGNMTFTVGASKTAAWTVTVGRSSLPDGLFVTLTKNGGSVPSASFTVHNVVNPPNATSVAPFGAEQWVIAADLSGVLTYDFYVLCDGRDMHIEGTIPPLGSTVSKDYNDDGTPTNKNPWNTNRPEWADWFEALFNRLFKPFVDFVALIIALVRGLVAILDAVVTFAGIVVTISGQLVAGAFQALNMWSTVWFLPATDYRPLASWLGPLISNGTRWFTGAQFAAAVDKYLGAVWTMIYPTAFFQFISWAFAAWTLVRVLFGPNVSVDDRDSAASTSIVGRHG
jgi:hypothetical protein